MLADNGASQEGGPFGVMHEMKFFNGIFETADQMIDQIDDIGGPHSHTNYPWGWAQCGNSPFKWYKQNTHEGGVHVPMIVHAPGIVRSRARCATSSSTCPTSCRRSTTWSGSTAPEVYKGLEQLPVTGRSFPHAFGDADRRHANTLQYFEMGWQPGACRRCHVAAGKRCASTTRAPTTTPNRGSCTTSPTTGRSATTSPSRIPRSSPS